MRKIEEICSPLKSVDPEIYDYCVHNGYEEARSLLDAEIHDFGDAIRDEIENSDASFILMNLVKYLPNYADFTEKDVLAVLEDGVQNYIRSFKVNEKYGVNGDIDFWDKASDFVESMVGDELTNRVFEIYRRAIKEEIEDEYCKGEKRSEESL